MARYRHFALARVALMLVVLVFAGVACSLGGGDDRDSESRPTVAATITPPLTRTPIPTFTAFPTLTPFQSGGFQPVPTATRIALFPTSPYYYTPVVSAPTPHPYDVRISYPVDGSQIAGYVAVIGSASHPRFLQYAIEWGPDPNPGNLWYPITPPQTRPVLNGALGAVNTAQVNDGVYQIRLHLWLNDGTETFDIATGIRISNRAPTAIPTLTPTRRPNRSPVVSPIPSQEVNAGSVIGINVTASDPDGDTLNLLAASSNNAIATAQVISKTAINVTGVTAGVATINVTVSDARGGLATTAFIVTVKGQNRAPTISPILAQVLDVGQTLDVTVAVSDPDGDTLTLTALSDNTSIVTASAPNNSTVRLTGVAVGSANVTITANDGKGGVINTAFRVDVGEPNRPPTIDAVPAQTLTVGEMVDVPYVANDPDGDAITAVAGSDTPGVVTASVTVPGSIRLVAAGAGPATVTLSVEDGEHTTISTFPVTVVIGNVAPTINPIEPQTMSVNETKDVNYTVIDPEGDPVNAQVNSDNTGVVTANINTAGTITLNASSAGTATIMLTIDDGKNPSVSMPFTVSVAALNLPPVIETIFPQTLNVDQTLDVTFVATDPDGDTLDIQLNSTNPGVVTASAAGPNTISLYGVSAGATTVTLTVSDANNPAVSMPFSVTVIAPNSPPSINPIDAQSLNVGQPLNVGYLASDPEGDALNEQVASDNTGVVTATISAPGTITLNGVGAGTATVTLTVSDGINAPVSMPFSVTVIAPNGPPSVNPIGAQSLNVGQSLDVGYLASDPEGDALNEQIASDNTGVVTANISAPGTITLTGVGAGTATVTLTVSDGINAPVSMPFSVTVVAVNSNPTIQGVGPQSVDVNASLTVPVQTSDPEGDPLTLMAVSDNPTVATANALNSAEIVVNGVAPGTANITVDASDNRGGVASTTFQVTVIGTNNPPVIQPIPDQSLTVGEQINIPVAVSDADGDLVTMTVISENPGVVAAESFGTDTIVITGIAEGATLVNVTADDARGGVTTLSFGVTVSSPAAPSFDLMAYPVLPDISSAMAQTLQQLYQSAGANFGVQARAFSKVGGAGVESQDFLVPFASDSPSINLGNYGYLQGTIDFYRAGSVRSSDPAINSFNVNSAAASEGEFNADQLMASVVLEPVCEGVGSTPLACEYQLTRPAIALISFDPSNVIYMDPSVFRSTLQSLVQTTMAQHGAIPVLATIPSTANVSTEQLAEYNRAIVEVATQFGGTGIPLWNLWRAMREHGVDRPFTTAPEGPANFSEGALSYGYNVRNLTALQVLDTIRQAVGIN